MNNPNDYVRGCMLGLFVGDSAGATLEFFAGKINEVDVDNAMSMPGGGAHNVGPGQVTDDSEMAMHLLYALCKHDPADGFPGEDIALEYIAWHRSCPFDMGLTCGRALAFANSLATVRSNALLYSPHSEANGALMRVAPLALWARTLDQDTIAQYARNDALLTHPNPVCQDCNAIYCLALAWLVQHPGDADGAVACVQNFTTRVDSVCPVVKQWLNDSVRNETLETMDCTKNMGHVKYAFTLSFWFLRRKTQFELAIYNTLLKGGDTDTNAAIVGAMLGALHGETNIPNSMMAPVLACDCTKLPNNLLGQRRPAFYNARRALDTLVTDQL